jgi:hypothetical protein
VSTFFAKDIGSIIGAEKEDVAVAVFISRLKSDTVALTVMHPSEQVISLDLAHEYFPWRFRLKVIWA